MSVKSVDSFDGVSLSYELKGEGDPVLLFVHGWSCNRRFFEKQIAYFSEKYCGISMDLAGHGQSADGRSEWSIENYARDVAAVVDAESLRQVVLIGHSMGGGVVLEAARLIGSRVAAVVMVDTHVFDYGHLSDEERGGILDPMQADLNAFIAGLVENTLPENAPAGLAAWVHQEMSTARLDIALPSFASLLDWDAAPTLSQLSAPVFAINGSLINATARDRYRNDVRELSMPDVGHFPQLEDAPGFNERLSTALQLLQD